MVSLPQQPNPPQGFFADAKTGFNVSHWFVVSYAMCFYPFLHSRFGRRGLGIPGFLAWLGIALYAAMMQSPSMLLFDHAYFCMCVFRRLTYSKEEISEYRGWAWLASLCLFGNRNERLLRFIEPFFVLAAGAYLIDYDRPMGLFFILGGFAMHLTHGIDLAMLNRQKEEIEDARKWARLYQRQMREDV